MSQHQQAPGCPNGVTQCTVCRTVGYDPMPDGGCFECKRREQQKRPMREFAEAMRSRLIADWNNHWPWMDFCRGWWGTTLQKLIEDHK